jgi:small-conductance mechanosensitive channel
VTGAPAPSTWRRWAVAVFTGAVALAALVAGSAFGHVSGPHLNARLIGWSRAGALCVFGTVSTNRVSRLLAHHVSSMSLPTAGSAIRIIAGAVGYLIVIFGVLAVLNVSIEHLLVGAGLAGVVLGIAAQQSLGNVFAGLVLIMAKPFRVGQRIRVRSGSLGGIFDARVLELSLTYVTLQTDDGVLRIPNSAMLAAGVVSTPSTPLPPPAAPTAPAAPAASTLTAVSHPAEDAVPGDGPP